MATIKKAKPVITSTKHLLTAAELKSFMFDGNARFTLKNKTTGNYITFQIHRPKHIRYNKITRNGWNGRPYTFKVRNPNADQVNQNLYNVYVKALNDGYSGKLYIGQIDRFSGEFTDTPAQFTNHVGVKTISWLIRNWKRMDKFVGTEMDAFHNDYCCKCGLPLSVEESVVNGMGSDCLKNHLKGNDAIFLELNIYSKGKEQNAMITEALGIDPSLIKKLYLPPSFPRQESVEVLELANEFGLF